ncbi:transposable element Tc1 transposase [Trichonephila clavipes]|nr:transposable element Tc1 transposase [Trichonephila clavipes]
MGVSKSVISRLKSFAEDGNALQNHTEGQGKKTIPLEYRYVAFVAKRNRNFTFGRIVAYLVTTTGRGVMVWAGIMHNNRTPLHILERRSVTTQRYCRENILDNVRIYRSSVGPDFKFMGENAWSHRSVEVSDTLQSETILRMQWTVYSPDLNPIKPAYNALSRRVALRAIPPSTTQERKTALRQKRDNIPQGILDILVQSMEKRRKMCISVHGQHTSY